MRPLHWLAIALASFFLPATVSVRAESVGQSRPEQLGFSREKLGALTEFFREEVLAGKVPGVIMLVQRHGQPAYFETFGVRDVATRAPMTPDTLFRIYSMTKPITSVTVLMLVEAGKLSLDEPVSKYIPGFAFSKVGVEKIGDDGKTVLDLVPVQRPVTVLDLLRHTSGITYSWVSRGLIYSRYEEERFETRRFSNQEFAERIAALPLSRQPGTAWEYGHSTDVLGRVIEVVEGKPLLAVFREKLFDPLGMTSTSFDVTEDARHPLIAEPLPVDGGAGPVMFDPRNEMKWQSGGGGLVSTIGDYARFAQMIANGGVLDGKRYLGPGIFSLMASDHIALLARVSTDSFNLPGPGFGFGLGFSVRLEQGAVPGSIGELNWGGAGGTYFWVDRKEGMFVVLMMQSYAQRDRYRRIIRNLVYSALEKPN